MENHRVIALRRLIENAETLTFRHAPKRMRKLFKVGQIVSEIIPFDKARQEERDRPFFIPVQGKFKILEIINDKHLAKVQNLRDITFWILSQRYQEVLLHKKVRNWKPNSVRYRSVRNNVRFRFE